MELHLLDDKVNDNIQEENELHLWSNGTNEDFISLFFLYVASVLDSV